MVNIHSGGLADVQDTQLQPVVPVSLLRRIDLKRHIHGQEGDLVFPFRTEVGFLDVRVDTRYSPVSWGVTGILGNSNRTVVGYSFFHPSTTISGSLGLKSVDTFSSLVFGCLRTFFCPSRNSSMGGSSSN